MTLSVEVFSLKKLLIDHQLLNQAELSKARAELWNSAGVQAALEDPASAPEDLLELFRQPHQRMQ